MAKKIRLASEADLELFGTVAIFGSRVANVVETARLVREMLPLLRYFANTADFYELAGAPDQTRWESKGDEAMALLERIEEGDPTSG